MLTVQQIDPDRWDEYLSGHPLGHHEQSSRFAEMRAGNGFDCARVGVVTEQDELAGGAQVLFRYVPTVGRLAFISQGPLVSGERRDVAEAVVQGLDQFARERRIARLRIINYSADAFWAPLLSRFGFCRSGYRWAARGTLLIRCDREDDAILAGMKSTCRHNIRLAYRKGVCVKVAGEDDIGKFHQLLEHTARRQKFAIFPLDYFQDTWRRFAPKNKLRIFLAYAGDEPLAGVIATVVGDRVFYGWGGLSPNQANLMANYATHWEAIRWARSLGCKFYDLAGGAGGDGGVDQFKSRWGGEPTAYPDAFDKYYGFLSGLRRRATLLAWDNRQLRGLVSRIDYRLRGSMPY
jgi:peptidoglycan pentaglycine glycine transferase (the first glycine)